MLFKRSRRVSLRRVALVTGDVAATILAIFLAAFIRLHPHDVAWFAYLQDHATPFLMAGVIFLMVMYAAGLYEPMALSKKGSSWFLPFLSSAIALTIMILVFFAWPDFQVGRGVLLLAGFFVFLGGWALRNIYRIAVGFGFLSRNALIVGDSESAETIIRLIKGTEDTGLRVFGVVSNAPMKHGGFVQGIPVLGHMENLREFTNAYEIETVIVATALSREPSLLQTLRPLRYAGIELLDYAALYEELAQEIPLDHIDDEWLMHAAMNSSVIHIRKIKRIMDVVVAVVGLVLSCPVALVTSLAIRLDSPGPILYRQRRSGQEGEPYTLLKFRTMKPDAELTSGAVWAGKFDARVTRVGKFLRKWRIDEIPQLLNVLKGEMSLVGPRPERPEFIDTLAINIPFYRERLMVPPGITGWAQVKFPYAASLEASRRKLQYDLYYIKHMRFMLDCQILLRTFRTIIIGIRHSDDEASAVTEEPLVLLDPQPDAAKSDEKSA